MKAWQNLYISFSLERGLIFFHHLENYATEGIIYIKPSPWKNTSRKIISHRKAREQMQSADEVNDWTSFPQLLPTTSIVLEITEWSNPL